MVSVEHITSEIDYLGTKDLLRVQGYIHQKLLNKERVRIKGIQGFKKRQLMEQIRHRSKIDFVKEHIGKDIYEELLKEGYFFEKDGEVWMT